MRAPGAQSGPGGARILVCGSSDRRYTVSATSPSCLELRPLRSAGAKEKARCRCDTGPCGSSKRKTKCQQRLCSLGSAYPEPSFAGLANWVEYGLAASDKRMKLGLEYIIGFTSNSTIPRKRGSVSRSLSIRVSNRRLVRAVFQETGKCVRDVYHLVVGKQLGSIQPLRRN